MQLTKLKNFALAGIIAFIALSGFAILSAPATNSPPARLAPGPDDGRIAYLTALLMENLHYSQMMLDTNLSARFYDGYLESLDPRRENFLQSDIDEFAHYRTALDKLTKRNSGTADLTPAFEIYQRFVERLQQHDDYVTQLLKSENFKFTGSDKILIDRRHAPYPKDLNEAKDLWREQLRYQYLQEKLGREISPTNSSVIIPLTKSNYLDIATTLERHFRWNFHQATNWDSTDVLQVYLEALTHAYDPHSDYQNNAHAADFKIQLSLSLAGIGASLREDDGYCTITSLIPGGPADKKKAINKEDRIIKVAQGDAPPVDVVDMELDKVVQLIRGPKGTEVRLTVSRADDGGARRVLPPVSLIRDEIKLEDSEAKATLIEMPDAHGGTNRIGVINVPSFYAPIDSNAHNYISVDTAKLINKLKAEKVDGIILDLRSNPGGSLEEAGRFTGLFIKSGPVVLARDPNGKIDVTAATNPEPLYDGPLAVMVNRFSASAAEIAAAALQDYGRAIVVGDTATHGKGTVQNLNTLRSILVNATTDPGMVKITIRKFYRINGESTQLKGVVPDIILPDVLSYSPDIGETALENPLPYDTNAPANYQAMNLVAPYLDTLRHDSQQRIATNQDFIYINQDIEQFKKLQADKTLTVNERDLIKERQANETRQKARDKERDARKLPAIKKYEITVENADQPGLPEPLPLTVSKTNIVDARTLNGISKAVAKLDGNSSSVNLTGKTNITTSPIPPDPALNETTSILEDYISRLSASHILIAK